MSSINYVDFRKILLGSTLAASEIQSNVFMASIGRLARAVAISDDRTRAVAGSDRRIYKQDKKTKDRVATRSRHPKSL